MTTAAVSELSRATKRESVQVNKRACVKRKVEPPRAFDFVEVRTRTAYLGRTRMLSAERAPQRLLGLSFPLIFSRLTTSAFPLFMRFFRVTSSDKLPVELENCAKRTGGALQLKCNWPYRNERRRRRCEIPAERALFSVMWMGKCYDCDD